MSPGTSSISTAIGLGRTVQPGTYQVFVKALSYNSPVAVHVSLGGGETTIIPDQRGSDIRGDWSAGAKLTVTSPTHELRLTLVRRGPLSRVGHFLLIALYITPNAHALVLKSDTAIDVSYPTARDNSPPQAGDLAQHGSFETGLGAGWGLSSNRLVSLSSVWDPTHGFVGRASVRLPLDPSARNGSELALVSRIYQVVPNKRYTLSAWVRTDPGATATARLELANAFADVGTLPPGIRLPPRLIRTFTVGPSWKQISVSGYLLRYPTADYQIEIAGAPRSGGHLWIDGVSLTQGGHAPPRFVPAAPLEVGLLGEAPSNLYYADQPVRFQLRTANGANQLQRGLVHYQVYDYLNHLVAGGTRRVVVPGHATAVGQLDLSSLRRTGSFRVVLWVEGEQASQNEFLYDVVPRPQGSGPDPSSSIGTSSDFLPFQYRALTRLGIKWDRANSPAALFRWSLVEPQPGHFVWHDAQVDNARRAGISILGTLGVQAPSWAEQGGTVNVQQWQAYVRAVVTHYRGRVAAWEIWNEPFTEFSPAAYADLLEHAASVIREVDPSALIVGMGGAAEPSYVTDVIKVLDVTFPSWRHYVDVLAVHMYQPAQVAHARCRPLGQELGNLAKTYGLPVWNTETGIKDNGFFQTEDAPFAIFGTSLAPFQTTAQFSTASTKAVAGMADTFLETVGNGMSKWFYYDSRTAAAPDYLLPHFTLWEYDDTIRPKGVALAVLAHLFDHASTLGPVHVASPEVRVFLFSRGGTPIVGMYSCDGQQRAIRLPGVSNGEISAYDPMGNRVPTSGSTIQFSSLPAYVVGRGISGDALRSAFEHAAVVARPDAVPPALSINVWPTGPVRSSPPIELRWSAIDPASIPSVAMPQALTYSYRLTGAGSRGNWSGWSATSYVLLGNLHPGTYSFQVRARDAGGRESPVVSRTLTVRPS